MGTRQVIVSMVVVSLLAGATVAARTEDPPRSLELIPTPEESESTRIVAAIAFTGLRRISPETMKMQIAYRPGERFDHRRIARDVHALARLGWFGLIRVKVEDANGNAIVSAANPQHVRLVFDLEENPFLTGIEYSGSRRISRQQIDKLLAEKKLAAKLGAPEDPLTLHRIARAIGAALADLGCPEARVEIHRAEAPNATVRVRFEIADGLHLSVGRVTFDGDHQVSGKLLRRQMQRISPLALFGSLLAKDSYTREAIAEDRERLLVYYENHGYPEARIGDARVSKYVESSRRWIPWPRKMCRVRLEVGIPIEAGPLYHVESVRIGEALAQKVPVRNKSLVASTEAVQGHPYSARAIENLRRAWQARAQPKPDRNRDANFFNVETIRIMNANSGTVHIVLDRSRTPPYTVRHLEFAGIHRFPDRYFRSRVFLTEGASFDDRILEEGLARLARTGYFKPIKKEDIRVETNEVARTVDVTIRVEEIGQQRGYLTGGRGQLGNTLGIAYAVFNLLDREELLSSRIEGGPESLQLAIGFAKEGFLGSRGSLALSAFNTFLRPRLSGSVKGPFFRQGSEGVDAEWNYALTGIEAVSIKYSLSHTKAQYAPALPTTVTGSSASAARMVTSSHEASLGWAHDTGDERILLTDSVSGGWLGGSDNVVRSRAEFGRMMPDRIFDDKNSWAFRTTFTGVGSYSGGLAFSSRVFAGDVFVRGLRDGELGPRAVVSTVSAAGATKYFAMPVGADLVSAANAEYRVPIADGAAAAGFFDVGSGALFKQWLGPTRTTIADSTNKILHASTGIQVQWTVPGIAVPIRAYYAINVLRLDRWLQMPDGSLFHARDRFSAFGWALGSLF